MLKSWMKFQLELDTFIRFLDLEKISELGLDKSIILPPPLSTLLLSTSIAIRAYISDDLVVITLG